MSRPTREELFATRFDSTAGPDACWPWLGFIREDGYGTFGGGPERRAHRISYQLAVGPIPDDLVIDHLCRNRACVNPAHMEPVRQRTNIVRSPIAIPAINAAKTHCVRGHEFTPTNTYQKATRLGVKRECRPCRRDLRPSRAVA